MKFRIINALILAAAIYSCAPKVAVTAMQPDPVQVPPKIVETNVPNEAVVSALEEGRSLNEKYCANCHKLYPSKAFRADQWPSIIKRMQKKARITDDETALIQNYILSEL